jgi:hypothetical protein
MRRQLRLRDGAVGVLIGAALTVAVILGSSVAGATSTRATQSSGRAAQEDFMFQVMHFHTADQGGDTFNFYLHYRYSPGLPTAKYPNFVSIRKMLLRYMTPKRSQYIEVLNTRICTRIKRSFPLQAISCQFQAYNGVDPGYRSSIVTLGNIAPLAIPKP